MHPVNGRNGRRVITNPFGRKSDRYLAGFHTGTDYAPQRPTEHVRATRGGKVVEVGRDPNHVYGLYVVLRVTTKSGATRYAWYCHLSKFRQRLAVGQWLRTGWVVGIMGNTGNSTGRHLHYEERPASNLYAEAAAPILTTEPVPLWLRVVGWR